MLSAHRSCASLPGPGRTRGVDHLGFAVAQEQRPERLLEQVHAAGGTVRTRFTEPSARTAFLADPGRYLAA